MKSEWVDISFATDIKLILRRRRQRHLTPVLLPGKSHGRRSLVGCSPWGRWESDTTEWLHFHFSLSCIGEGNGNPLQCSCLENPRDREAWWAAVYGVPQSRTRLKRLSSSSSYSEPIAFTWHTTPSFLYESENESCSAVSDSLRPHGIYSPWDSPGQNTEVGSLSLLQGIFPTQGSNPSFLYCRQILYQLSHKGSPGILEWVVYHASICWLILPFLLFRIPISCLWWVLILPLELNFVSHPGHFLFLFFHSTLSTPLLKTHLLGLPWWSSG